MTFIDTDSKVKSVVFVQSSVTILPQESAQSVPHPLTSILTNKKLHLGPFQLNMNTYKSNHNVKTRFGEKGEREQAPKLVLEKYMTTKAKNASTAV